MAELKTKENDASVSDDLIAFLVADHKLFGLIKRKKPVKQIDRSQSLTDDQDA